MSSQLPSICFIATAEIAVKAFLADHIRQLSKSYEVFVMVNTLDKNFLADLGVKSTVIPIKIQRKIDFFNDIRALLFLIRIIKTNDFKVIHTITPKAGLLGMVAAILCNVPYRIHTFTGQVWANKVGFMRLFLKCFDKLIATISTHAFVDSPSQLDFLISEGVFDRNKAFVFGKGSVSGVDVNKFKPNSQVRTQLRSKLKIDENELVFLFLGRLNLDKGVLDLASAFIQANLLNCKLLFVGPDEGNMQAKIATLPNFDNTKISFIGYTDKPQNFMVASDVLCLPSYREGFGSVIIEAAACGLPTVGSRIYGITDAIDENFTGLMHEAGDILDLQSKLAQIASDKTLRERLGQQAYQRAINDFNSVLITSAWCEFYKDVIFKDE